MYFNSDKAQYKLEESPDKIIIRTKGNLSPTVLFEEYLSSNEINSIIDEPIHFPEASVFVYKIREEGLVHIDPILKKLNQVKGKVKYAGHVLQNVDTKAYQIYTGNIFVKFKDLTELSLVNEIMQEYKLVIKQQLGFCDNGFFVQPSTNQGKSIFQITEKLKTLDLIEYCDPEIVVKRKAFKKEKKKEADPMLGLGLETISTGTLESTDVLESLETTSKDPSWVNKMIRLDEAWKTTKGKGIKICIIDDGIDSSHQAFNRPGKIVTKIDLLDPSSDGDHVFDSEMHGTACASVAGSEDSKAPGVAPEASLMILRTKGLGSVLEAQAIYEAVNNGADIISCSWGPEDGDIMEPNDNNLFYPLPDHTRLAIDYAVKNGRNGKGCLIFFAAGNGGEEVKYDGYARYENVMAIGAVNKERKLSQYSDRGYSLFCCFPSSEIIFSNGKFETIYGLTTADRIGDLGFDDSDYFNLFGGTSASAPGMAGVAALMLAIDPELTLSDAKVLMAKSCKLTDFSRSEVLHQQMGWGIIDAHLLVENTKNHKNKGHMKSDTTSKKNNNNSGSNDHTNTNSASNNNSTSPSNNTPSRYALHVALDNVNQQVYNNVYADLDGCINDSKLYQSLTAGFTSQTILNDDDATRENFKSELKKLAKNAKSGDFVFISYAGHGGTIQDHNNDEEDGGNDETLILYDGIWIDDETKELIYSFKDGVNILFVSDSCHSGTNTRGKRGLSIDIPNNHSESARKYRGIKSGYIRKVYQENKDFYDREWAKLKNIGRGKKNDSPKASVVSIAACQDDQLANEINKNGVFTLAFMEAVQNNPSIALEDILEEVRDGIETQYIYDQNPVFSNYGNNNDALKKMSFSDLFTGARVEQVGPISDIDEAEPKNKYELVSTGYLLTETDALPITDSTSNKARGINDDISSAWDAAYSAYFQSDKSEFIEPDIIAVDHINKELENKRGNKNPDKYLHTYPAPELTDPDRFSWHKGDLFSQLDQAFRNACPESNANNPADKSSYPIIAHIDTGILSNHPSLPLHYDDTLSNNFTNAEDKDKWFAFAEQQGHGHATVSILAGQSFETQLPDGDTMPRYFGAFPYAQVISLKISESVFITRAKNFAKAVEYAISQNVDVITMSMAGAPSKRMLNAINKAYEKGITIVSAGGNSWTKFPKVLLPKSIMYPARFNRVIAAVGTTYLDTPYLVKTPPKRAEGSPHMQSCYGPAIAMETAIAAYTPNITWLSHKDAPYYSRSGGGTSSATPQIAAAVALFLHKNRDFISKHITQPQDQWKKIELARKALFETAKKDTGYDSYYGNGILQANEMMNFDVNLNVLNSLEKHDPDSLGRTGIDDLFKMWKRRSKSGKDSQKYNDPILEEMLALEIEQLIVSQEEFQEFSLNDGISVDLANAILKSPRSSKFLKSMMARKGNKSLRAQQSNQSFVRPIYDVDLDDSSRVTYWSNSPYNVTKREVPNANKEEIIESFEIDLEDNLKNLNRGFRSSLSSIEIGFSYDKNNVNPIHLVEVELYDGTKRYKWVYANEIKDKKKRGNESLEAFVPYGESYVSLSTVSNNSTRGLGSWLKKLGQKIKKIIVNVVRIIKDEPKSGLKGLIYRQITGRGKWSQYDGGTPKINTTKKTLLLIHGTWSHTEASFDELLKNNAFKNKLISEGYNSSILGYDMSTLKDSVTENAAEIKTKLASLKLDNNKLTVIAFSRGCLVAKEVFKDPANTPKMVFAGGTINGTPLAYKDNIPKVLDKITNLSVLATGGVVSGIFKLVSFLTKKLLDLPGLKDQAPNSALIINQRGFVYDAKKHIFIGANFEPTGLIKKTLDTRYDVELFADQPNDGVTPVSSSLNLKPGEDGSELPNLLITSGNINHFNLFDDNDAIQRVINHV